MSFGIGPNRIDEVVGVAKAYVTRVGEGPFPSEIDGPANERVREIGKEFGTVTGRERRCGWLDLVALRFAVRVNGITSLALTKLDVLSGFAELPICARYRLPDGEETEEFPSHQSDFHHCRPVFETLSGWQEEIGESLPPAAQGYVSFVERALGVPVTLVGTGAAREHVLSLAKTLRLRRLAEQEQLRELMTAARIVEAAEEDVVILALDGRPVARRSSAKRRWRLLGHRRSPTGGTRLSTSQARPDRRASSRR